MRIKRQYKQSGSNERKSYFLKMALFLTSDQYIYLKVKTTNNILKSYFCRHKK